VDQSLSVRIAHEGDVPALHACAEDAYQQYVATIGDYIPPMVADFSSLTATGCVYVATDKDDRLLGYIVFYQRDDHIFLENVAVRPHATGGGVGKGLISFCEAKAKDRKARSVQLYTNEKMTDNLSIYPYLGYRETERKTEDGFHRVFFEKLI